ncbi:PAS domain-containing protein, partial [Arthrospira platensis SPKY1]|nr:PAS domain-containing protein [Arthrospira platensis SPKY1]
MSDRAMLLLFDDPALILRASVAKGWLFVAITGMLLYYLVSRLMNGLAEAYRRETQLEAERTRTLRMVETIWNNSADAVYAKDAEGRYTLANKKVGEYVGRAVADLIGQDDTALFPLDEARALMEFERRVRRNKAVVVTEERLNTALGERHFITTKGPILDQTDQVVGTFGIAHDVTELKRTEDQLRTANASLNEQRMLLQLFMQHAPAALAMLDKNLNHLLASHRWLEDYGVSEADMSGPNHYDVFPEIPEQWREVHRRALAGETIRSDGECFERFDGRKRWVRWEVLPWRIT